MEKIRRQFEKHIALLHNKEWTYSVLGGKYRDEGIQLAWEVWQHFAVPLSQGEYILKDTTSRDEYTYKKEEDVIEEVLHSLCSACLDGGYCSVWHEFNSGGISRSSPSLKDVLNTACGRVFSVKRVVPYSP